MNAVFLNLLHSTDLPGGGSFRLDKPLRFYSAILNEIIEVPKGFVADSYSVPRLFAFLVHKADRRPAFIHDWLYDPNGPDVTQRQADRVLLEAMKAAGLSWLQRRIIYRGPRVAGRFFFKEHEHESVEPFDPSPGA